MPVQMMHDPVSLSADVCACNDMKVQCRQLKSVFALLAGRLGHRSDALRRALHLAWQGHYPAGGGRGHQVLPHPTVAQTEKLKGKQKNNLRLDKKQSQNIVLRKFHFIYIT